MATILHSVLTGSENHEPKGIDAASANQVYLADGAGSGTHKRLFTCGWEDFNDLTTATTPITIPASFTHVDLTNDGAGAFSDSTYRLPGNTAIWDTVADEFDWTAAGLSLGDTVDIRIDLMVTTVGANTDVGVGIDLAHGHASEYSLDIHRTAFKTAGTYPLTRWYSVYIGDADVLANPAKIWIASDGAGTDTVKVNGWYVRTVPIHPVYSA